jgi:hypothetical protein
MNIAIFDLQHFEMVYVWHRVLGDPKNNIHFFINQNILSKIIKSGIPASEYNALAVDDFQNIDDFFNACLKHTREHNIDAIVLNTVDVHYKSTWKFVKQLSIPVFITIHNINTWLNPPFTLNRKALGYYYYRKKMIARSGGIILQEELFIDYVKNNTGYKKPLFAFPYTLNDKQTPLPSNSKLVVAIPGAIDGHRRDNDFSLSVIKKVSAKNKNVQFVFLGGIVGHLGEKIYEQMNQLQREGCDILHFYDKNSNVIFDEQMSNCDIVFLPLIVETKYEGITEIYGKTKATGVLYDLMRFQKPCLAPEALVIPPTIRNCVISYKNENDFVDMIIDLETNRPKVIQLLNNAKVNSEYYTVEKIKERFLGKFTALLSELSLSK